MTFYVYKEIMRFHSHANYTHFHMNGCETGLALIDYWKWTIEKTNWLNVYKHNKQTTMCERQILFAILFQLWVHTVYDILFSKVLKGVLNLRSDQNIVERAYILQVLLTSRVFMTLYAKILLIGACFFLSFFFFS